MPTQPCPNCGLAIDTSVFVSGQKIPCPRCALSIEISRSDVASRRVAGGISVKPLAATEPTHPADSRPTSDTRLFGSGEPGATAVRPQLNVPGYQLVQVIGRGGMGEVWQAKQVSLGREVAIKVLAQNLASEDEFVKRFEKEAAALAALSHPGIVQIIDRGTAEGVPFFAMEFVHGQTLRELIEARRLSPGEALKIITQVGAAIDYAHARGVIHRDLKPENILIDAEGRVKVADFGLAGIRDQRFNVTRTSMTMGTLNYMAPEQRKDAKSVDARADIFSLGVMLYELLTGDVPVGHFKPPSELVPALDHRIDVVVLRALEPEPAARFQKASEMIRMLEGLLSTISLPAESLPDAVPPVRPQGLEVPAVATRPDSPGNVGTHPPELHTLAPRVVTHVRRAGRFGMGLVVTFALLLGTLVILKVVLGKDFISIEDHGLSLIGGRIRLAGSGAVDAGPAAMPADTHADVGIALESHGSAPGEVVLDSALGSGTDATLIALDGAWQAGAEGLTARAFDRMENASAHPRATLEEPSFRLRDFSVQVTVSLDPTPPAGYTPQRPRAVLFFHGESNFLELTMQLGDKPVYRLFNKYTDSGGKLQLDRAGDAEFNQLSPPPPRTKVVLRLVSKGGQLTLLADNKPVLQRPLKLGAEVIAQVGRIGFGCEEATCRFSGLHVEGSAVKDRALFKEDQHAHTIRAPLEARAR